MEKAALHTPMNMQITGVGTNFNKTVYVNTYKLFSDNLQSICNISNAFTIFFNKRVLYLNFIFHFSLQQI